MQFSPTSDGGQAAVLDYRDCSLMELATLLTELGQAQDRVEGTGVCPPLWYELKLLRAEVRAAFIHAFNSTAALPAL